MNIEFKYSHSIESRMLDALTEQALYDAATDAAMQFRMQLLKFWSTATPRRRAESTKNRASLAEE